MNDEEKKCESCAYFSVYYTRGYNNFYKKNIGLCRIGQDKSVSKEDICEKWRYNEQAGTLHIQKAKDAIPTMIDQLIAVTHILQEALEKEKQNNN